VTASGYGHGPGAGYSAPPDGKWIASHKRQTRTPDRAYRPDSKTALVCDVGHPKYTLRRRVAAKTKKKAITRLANEGCGPVYTRAYASRVGFFRSQTGSSIRK